MRLRIINNYKIIKKQYLNEVLKNIKPLMMVIL